MDKQNLLIIGGTGSLGKTIIQHFIDDYNVSVFSRDEAKHVMVKQLYPTVQSLIGDIRDRDAISNAIIRSAPDIVINAAALKNVPEVEEAPMEGVKTSLLGTDNLSIVIKNYILVAKKQIKSLMISTDKSCKPVNSYGMAKALQERIHIRSDYPGMICNAVRYGNVLESRGSLIPILKQRLKANQPIYITHQDMTRFFLTLDDSVELIKRALQDNEGGKIFVPIIRSAKILDVIELFCQLYNKDLSIIQPARIRPGEKIDEIMVSLEETSRTQRIEKTFIIHDILTSKCFHDITTEYSSGDPYILMNREETRAFLLEHGVFDVT